MATSAMTLINSRPETTSPTVWRGLLLREWWAHRPLLLGLANLYAASPIAAYAIAVLVFESPGAAVNPYSAVDWAMIPRWWTFWIGVTMALFLGLALGGAETSAGLEEGSLSLPATRHQRFWARFAFAASILLAHAILNTIAMVLWSYVLPRVDLPCTPLHAWMLSAFIAPLVILALAWTAAVNGGPRRRLLLALSGLALMAMTWSMAGSLHMAGISLDQAGITDIYGLGDIYPLILLGWSIWMLHLAYRIYCTREIHALQDH